MLTKPKCLWCRSVFVGVSFLQEEKDPSVLTKNSFSWICPVLTELRAGPWEAQGDLCVALIHTHGHRAVPRRMGVGRSECGHVLMPLNVSNCPLLWWWMGVEKNTKQEKNYVRSSQKPGLFI